MRGVRTTAQRIPALRTVKRYGSGNKNFAGQVDGQRTGVPFRECPRAGGKPRVWTSKEATPKDRLKSLPSIQRARNLSVPRVKHQSSGSLLKAPDEMTQASLRDSFVNRVATPHSRCGRATKRNPAAANRAELLLSSEPGVCAPMRPVRCERPM
jgi:hypothetical protein